MAGAEFLLPTLSNVAILPAMDLALKNFTVLYIELIYLALTFTVSYIYHLNLTLGLDAEHFERSRQLDHAVAEGLLLVVAPLFVHSRTPRHQRLVPAFRRVLQGTLLGIHIIIKLYSPVSLFFPVAAAAVVILGAAATRQLPEHLNWYDFSISGILLVLAVVFYAIDVQRFYYIFHTLWHVFGFLSVYYIFRAVNATSNEWELELELQRRSIKPQGSRDSISSSRRDG